MSRTMSITTRRAMTAGQTDEVAVGLVTITHPSIPDVVRLSSDPTERLSDNPLTYGTVSMGQEHLFALMGVVWPDDQEGAPPRARFVLNEVEQSHVALLRSMPPGVHAKVDIAIVLASDPDLIDAEFKDLSMINAEFDASTISFEISKEPLAAEPWPCDRMTKDRLPGLYA
ncbi:hypothetical protein ACLBXM_20065 [Xanthobacteraceae bacterium A53D]